MTDNPAYYAGCPERHGYCDDCPLMDCWRNEKADNVITRVNITGRDLRSNIRRVIAVYEKAPEMRRLVDRNLRKIQKLKEELGI